MREREALELYRPTHKFQTWMYLCRLDEFVMVIQLPSNSWGSYWCSGHSNRSSIRLVIFALQLDTCLWAPITGLVCFLCVSFSNPLFFLFLSPPWKRNDDDRIRKEREKKKGNKRDLCSAESEIHCCIHSILLFSLLLLCVPYRLFLLTKGVTRSVKIAHIERWSSIGL